jgi:hypothetical protein
MLNYASHWLTYCNNDLELDMVKRIFSGYLQRLSFFAAWKSKMAITAGHILTSDHIGKLRNYKI